MSHSESLTEENNVVWIGCQCQASHVQQDLDLPDIQLETSRCRFISQQFY